MTTDTIAALSTAFGEAAVAVIRLSGPESVRIASLLTASDAALWPVRSMVRRTLRVQGQAVDDMLTVRFAGPASFTGEDLVEFHLHGGLVLARTALDGILAAGARAAEPGEFTQRAFLNGKLDLTQAEAVMDLIRARGAASLQAAHAQLAGGLGDRITAIRDEILEALAHVEAYVDFPEEDIDPDTGAAMINRITSVGDACRSLAATAEAGGVLRDGARIVIAGKPNVGKSSLLNALLGEDRAIVAELPGTTRDTIEETTSLHGIPVRFVDTAGLRETEDTVEQEGVRRSLAQIARAELVLHLYAADTPETPQEDGLVILNKRDLSENPAWATVPAIRISCRTGAGLDELRERMHAALVTRHTLLARPVATVNARHHRLLDQAVAALDAAAEALRNGVSPEFVSIDLREALDFLGEIVGKVDTEQLLDRVFANFCIGK